MCIRDRGKVLEETGERIGIVHNIAAPTRFKIIVEGIAVQYVFPKNF